MRPDSRSVSFTFHREMINVKKSPEVVKRSKNFRQRLQDKFDKEKSDDVSKRRGSKSRGLTDRGWNNISLSNVSTDSRRMFRNGAERLSKTISSVRTSFGTLSDKFRGSICKRQRLEEQSPGASACKSQTPQTRTRQILGRTPTKLYSPFGIESPRLAWGKENETPSSKASLGPNSRRLRCIPFRLSRSKGFSMLR